MTTAVVRPDYCPHTPACEGGKDFCNARPLTFPLPETILEEAQRLVMGPKEEDYGHPTADFARTGRIWGAMLGIPDIHPRVVALMCVGIKLSREMNASKRDNRVDIAGYALTAQRVDDREAGLE